MTLRGVSFVMSYVLSLIVITTVVTGVFIAGSDYVENVQSQTIRSELAVIGNRIAGGVSTVDQWAIVDSEARAELRVELPKTVAGKAYTVNVSSDASGPTKIQLATGQIPVVSVTIKVNTVTPVAGTRVGGGPLSLRYNGSVLVVRDG